jgi:hypothetical protein
MKKTFDCVRLKQEAQTRISSELRGMSPAQELAYWAEAMRRLRDQQERVRAATSKKSA